MIPGAQRFGPTSQPYRFRLLTRLHRFRAEKALGKPLPLKAIVHHADGSKADDAPLVICQDAAYHALLHARMRIKAAGGNPNTDRICVFCRLVKPISEFYPSAARLNNFGQWRCIGCPVRSARRRQRKEGTR
jgi:hypothetical protein